MHAFFGKGSVKVIECCSMHNSMVVTWTQNQSFNVYAIEYWKNTYSHYYSRQAEAFSHLLKLWKESVNVI